MQIITASAAPDAHILDSYRNSGATLPDCICELIDNSFDAGAIKVEITMSSDQITVKDNGCGMDEITQRKIFDPFFTTKAFGRGTGLGLSTSLGYLKEMNAQISVKSEPGVGSEFTLNFPISNSKGENHGNKKYNRNSKR